MWGLFAVTARAGGWPDLSAPPPVEPDGAGDAALLVGIDGYVFLPPVPGADDAVRDWRRFLVARGVPLANVQVLVDADAAREQILAEAAVVRERVAPGGTLWVVFVGHGAPAPDGRDGLLVGVDAQRTAVSLEARSVRRDELLSAVAGGPQAGTVVVLDACFSGRTGAGAADTLVPGLQPLVPTYALPSKVATVLSAGAADQFAGPLPGLGRPAFSYLALGALRGWGDADGDGAVTAREAVTYAEGALSVLVNDRRQTPQVDGAQPERVLARGRERGPDLLALADALGPRPPPSPAPAPTPALAPPVSPPPPPGPGQPWGGFLRVGPYATLAGTGDQGAQPWGAGLAMHGGGQFQPGSPLLGLIDFGYGLTGPLEEGEGSPLPPGSAMDLQFSLGLGHQVGPVTFAGLVGAGAEDGGLGHTLSGRFPFQLWGLVDLDQVAFEVGGGPAVATAQPRPPVTGPIDDWTWFASVILARRVSLAATHRIYGDGSLLALQLGFVPVLD